MPFTGGADAGKIQVETTVETKVKDLSGNPIGGNT
jgi:hypothetical protein